MAVSGNGQLLIKVTAQPLRALLAGGPAAPVSLPGYSLELLSPALRARPNFSDSVPADHWLLAKPAQPKTDNTPWNTAHAAASATGYQHYIEPDILHAADAKLARKPDEGLNDNWQPKVPNTVGVSPGWHLLTGFAGFDTARRLATGAGIRIAHLDTGYTPGHASVPRNLDVTLAYDYWDNKPGAVDPYEQFLGILQPGHGTATLALLAGNTLDMQFGTFSYRGDFGGAPDAEIVPVRISPSVVHVYTSTMAKGLLHALAPNGDASKRCDVVSISHGGLPSQSWADAVNELYQAGTIIVAASGDSFYLGVLDLATRYTVYPSAFNRVITAVGGTYDKKPYITDTLGVMQGCWGPDAVMQKAVAGFTPNIAWMRYNDLPNGFDMNGGGTSASTPQVAAACALWLQLNRSNYASDWSRIEACRLALFESADRTAPDQSELGWGCLNAAAALDPALAGRILADYRAGTIQPSPEDQVSFPFWRLLIGAAPPNSDEERMYETEVAHTVLTADSPDLRRAPGLFQPGSALSDADRAKYLALLNSENISNALRTRLKQVASPRPPAPQVQDRTKAATVIVAETEAAVTVPAFTPAPLPRAGFKLSSRHTGWIFAGATAFIFFLNWWGIHQWPDPVGRYWIWLGTLASAVVAIALVGKALEDRFDGILIDNRNMMSLAKFQMLVWTLVVLPALATAAASNIVALLPTPIDIGLPTPLLAALGIAGASFIATPIIHSTKSDAAAHPAEMPQTLQALKMAPGHAAAEGKLFTKTDSKFAQWADMFRGDEVGNADTADLGKIQQFFVTLLLAGVYGGAIADMFLKGGQITSLPAVSDQFVWLLGISHGTYVGSNVAPHTKNP